MQVTVPNLKTFLLTMTMLSGLAMPTLASAAPQDTTVVLVHGAFVDGSEWNKVVPLLQAKGLKVVSVQNPLTSLAEDVAATQRAIAQQTGKVVLVGHSWGGMVITEAGASDKVSALVYISAFAPSEGQAAGDLGKEYEPPAGMKRLQADNSGYLSLPPEAMVQDFAPDAPKEETRLMAVSQVPINSKAFGEKVTTAAWKTKPSYFIVAGNDRMMATDLQMSMAKKIGAKTVVLKTSHAPMLSKPQEVADVILEAATR
jgi:pimeloyl-ACP methyl ester carboxylesterase